MSTQRQQFDTAYRAHRAWDTRRIPYGEYDTATSSLRVGMPAVHAMIAHKARTWTTDRPQRLTWKRDSVGRLDAYLGGGSSVTVMPAEPWTRAHGFVAVIDRMGIGGPPQYIDARGYADYGTVTGRSIVFATETQAKLAASRYLLRAHRARGKTVGQKLPKPVLKPNPKPASDFYYDVPIAYRGRLVFGGNLAASDNLEVWEVDAIQQALERVGYAVRAVSNEAPRTGKWRGRMFKYVIYATKGKRANPRVLPVKPANFPAVRHRSGWHTYRLVQTRDDGAVDRSAIFFAPTDEAARDYAPKVTYDSATAVKLERARATERKNPKLEVDFTRRLPALVIVDKNSVFVTAVRAAYAEHYGALPRLRIVVSGAAQHTPAQVAAAIHQRAESDEPTFSR